MRKFSIVKDENNNPRLALNNKPIFMKGVLDQGYYKQGLLTPESYNDYIDDIELVKSLGFNTIRKHTIHVCHVRCVKMTHVKVC